MSVNYTIRADVVDIRQDHPKPDDVFLVDTNVWYWLTLPIPVRVRQNSRPKTIKQTTIHHTLARPFQRKANSTDADFLWKN